MATYKPHEPMPASLEALRAKVLENRGLHYNFPYGIRLPAPDGGKDTWAAPIPEPLYEGLTLRGFFYAPSRGPKHEEFEMVNKTAHNFYYATSSINGTEVLFYFSGWGTNYDTVNTGEHISVPGYYSVAIRYTAGPNLTLYLGEKATKKVRQKYIIGSPWELKLRGGTHFLLSLHLSDEIPANPNFPTTNFGIEYDLGNIVLDIGSYWIMECIVIDPNKPLLVHVYLFCRGTHYYGETQFSLANVRRQSDITIFIRSVKEGWVVTTSFDGTVKLIGKEPKTHDRCLRPAVSKNCQILTQHVVSII